MKALLDTHIWVQNLAGSNDLPVKLKEILENDKNEIWLSPISIWEHYCPITSRIITIG